MRGVGPPTQTCIKVSKVAQGGCGASCRGDMPGDSLFWPDYGLPTSAGASPGSVFVGRLGCYAKISAAWIRLMGLRPFADLRSGGPAAWRACAGRGRARRGPRRPDVPVAGQAFGGARSAKGALVRAINGFVYIRCVRTYAVAGLTRAAKFLF